MRLSLQDKGHPLHGVDMFPIGACRAADHGVSASLYMADPDGNRVELYVDQSDAWKKDPAAVAHFRPLAL